MNECDFIGKDSMHVKQGWDNFQKKSQNTSTGYSWQIDFTPGL